MTGQCYSLLHAAHTVFVLPVRMFHGRIRKRHVYADADACGRRLPHVECLPQAQSQVWRLPQAHGRQTEGTRKAHGRHTAGTDTALSYDEWTCLPIEADESKLLRTNSRKLMLYFILFLIVCRCWPQLCDAPEYKQVLLTQAECQWDDLAATL